MRTNLKIPEPKTHDYPLLRQLFDCWPLDASSHAALYIALLGMFHIDSLSKEVPVLVIDSHEQGRGKSEIAKALQRLLSDSEAGISGSADEDTVTAFLLQGNRVLPFQNVHRAREWHRNEVVNLTTDGALHLRPKHARLTVAFRGVLPLLNFVYGRVTVHRDVEDRTFRVELPGTAAPLVHKAHEFADEHRLPLLGEILLAHKRATEAQHLPNYVKATRLAAFERAGARAYYEVFGKDPSAAMHLMVAGRKALLAEVPPLLFKAHRELFDDPSEKVVSTPAGKVPDPERFVGARALGFQLASDGKWHEICKE
jgi:hypothetical protein